MVSISIIVPLYNEELRLDSGISSIIYYSREKFDDFEVIAIDDGSTDRTFDMLSEYSFPELKVLRNDKNQGKGYSIRKGMLASEKSLVLFTDIDLSTPLEESEKLIAAIKEGYDIAIASRNLKDSEIKTVQPFYRQIMGKTFPFLVKILALQEFKDTQCGFKVFTEKAAKHIAQLQTLDRFSFDVEQLLVAKRHNYKIKEIPVVWIDQKGSKVNPIKDSINMFYDLLKIRYNDMNGRYNAKDEKPRP